MALSALVPLTRTVGTSLVGRAILDLTGYADRKAQRLIDSEKYQLRAEVTIDEDGDDELEITQHPVESGAAISDHAYKRPPEVRVRVGWSTAYIGDVKAVYQQIVTLQGERRPFTIYTGKRGYKEMLVASIRVHNDAKTEYSFIADITFRQIIRVSTQTIKSKVSTNEKQLAEPKKNLPAADQGKRNTTPASVSNNQVENAGGKGQIGGAGTDPATGAPIGEAPATPIIPPSIESPGNGGAVGGPTRFIPYVGR